MKTTKLFVLGSLTAMSLAFASCSKDTNVYDSEYKTNQMKADYATEFVKKFPGVNLNQSWDLASMTPSYSLVSSERALTRGDGSVNADATEGEILIEKTTIDWMSANMKAGTNNVEKGKPFFLQVPQNSFTIVPIFQGTASYYWQLWMYVDGIEEDKLIWSKGDIEYITSKGSTDWKKPGTGKTGMNDAYQVKAPTYTFENLPVNANMYFYLLVWDSYSDYKSQTINPRKLTSLDQMMLALIDCPRPTNVPEGNEVAIIGCEDNKSGDFDYEDLVFMMYGNPAPPIKHVDEVIVSETKRYMMEDLGEETPDFDFNDIVVDVSNRAKYRRDYKILENGGWELIRETKIEDLPQQAIVRAAGGTLDFTLKIGGTEWTKSKKFNTKEMLNTGWNGAAVSYGKVLDKFEVDGWDPSANNISVTVAGKAGNAVEEKTISFPKAGDAPVIIAVDPTTNWMNERTPAPQNWFVTE